MTDHANAPTLVCCDCGIGIGRTYARFQLEQFDLISQAEGHGRILTVDAALACSVSCLVRYLKTELEAIDA